MFFANPIVLCFVSSLLCLADSQAPGDGDEVCINDPQHPVYDDYIHPLMDTRDYIQLLPNSDGEYGVWQALDEDGNNPSGKTTEWRDSKGSCVNAPKVCGHEEGPQNNWIISQHISRQVPAIKIMFNLSINSCPPSSSSCVEALSLYVWETATPNATSAADTDNYHFITNLYSGAQQLTIDFSSSYHTGFYLGIRDNGTCATVNRVLVYYTTCGAATVGLVGVNETVFNSSSVVQGECVADSVAIHEEGPLVVCSEKGEWSVVSGCECITQHYMDSSGQQCLDCPANSEATQTGLTECPCVQDYYRADYEDPGAACTQSPSAPVNVTISNMTNTSATLSWLPPEYSGGRNISEITYNITYSASHSSVEVETISGVTATELELTDLVPFLNYTFSVTAENSVSHQDTNSNARTSNTAAFTLEGVAGKVTDILDITTEGQIQIVWREPDPPHGRILHYNIKVQQNGRYEIIYGYNSTSINQNTLMKLENITADNFKLQVQAETKVGPGEFSREINIITITSVMSGPTGLLLTIIVPAAVLITLIVATLLLIIFTLRRKRNIRESVEAYASVPISPVDSKAPPIPSSPRPNAAGGNKQENSPSMPQEGAYAVTLLEDPTQKGNSNRYGPDLPSSTNRNGHTNEQGPLYHILEDPQNSTILKNRENSLQTHVYESVANTHTPRANLPPSATAISGSNVNVPCSTDRNVSGGSTILETTTPYSTK